MALGHDHRIVSLDCAKNRNTEFFQRFFNHRPVRIGTKAIKDRSGDIDFRIVLLKTEYKGRRRFPHRLCIDDKQDGRLQQFRYLRRGTYAVFPAVVQSHHAFDNRNVRVCHRTHKNIRQPLFRHKPSVQIVRRTTAR